jgi:hypothetical protein
MGRLAAFALPVVAAAGCDVGTITSLTLAASPLTAIVGDQCVHESHTDFRL